MIGTNAFQVRRSPISVGLLDDEQVRAIAKRPLITAEDARAVARGAARGGGGGAPVGLADAGRRRRATATARSATCCIFGVTPPYQVVQDYQLPGRRRRSPSRTSASGARWRSSATRSPRSCSTTRRPRSASGSGSPGARCSVDGRDRAEGTACSGSRSTPSCCFPSAPSSRSTAGGRPPWSR